MKPLISVVIPTHNRSILLTRAVISALNQNYNNIEVIVVSDGSTDDTDDVVNKLQKVDERLRFIAYMPAKGANHARNIGIIESKGKYVAFLDDDDEWHPHKLDLQMRLFKSDSQIGLSCTAFYAIYEGENTKTQFVPPAQYDSSKQILISNCVGSTTTVMAKKDLLLQVGMFDELLKAQQDYDLWIRLCQITKIGVVRKPCVDYYNYLNIDQISKKTDLYQASIEYIENKYAELFSAMNKADFQLRKVNKKIDIAKKALRNGDKKLARKCVYEALRIKFTFCSVACWAGSFISPAKSRKIRAYFRILKYFIK